MATARGWRLTACVALVALTACGRSTPSAPPSPGHWAADPFVAEAPFRTPYWWGDVVEPSAENASLDTPEDEKRAHHILFVRKDGSVEALRDCGGFHAVHEVGHEDVTKVLVSWTEGDDEPCSTSWPVYVPLAADREAPWARVRSVLRSLSGLDVPAMAIRLAVSRWPSARAHHLALELRPCRDSEAGTPRTLDVRLAGGGPGQAVALEIGGRSWTFPPTPVDFREASFLGRANETWKDVKRHVAELTRGWSGVRLRVESSGDGPWWAYVVSVLDLLLGAGIHAVGLPEDGLCLAMQEPTAATWPVDEPALGWWMVTGSAAAVLLAFLVTFLPLWPSRRRRAAHPPM